MNTRYYKTKNALTFVEIVIGMAIFLVMTTGIYSVLSIGRLAWFNTEADITLQQNIRLVLGRLTAELCQSGIDKNSVSQVTIQDGAGVNAADILRFSIPVVCHDTDNVIDVNGDVAVWGAPLNWGCSSSSCMDADNDCATVDYKSVQYSIDNSNQMIRAVLNAANGVVREDILGQNINDFQISKSADQKFITLDLSAQMKSAAGKMVTVSVQEKVRLRNIN